MAGRKRVRVIRNDPMTEITPVNRAAMQLTPPILGGSFKPGHRPGAVARSSVFQRGFSQNPITGAFANRGRPSFFITDQARSYEMYQISPRLQDLWSWLIKPTKPNLEFLAINDNVVQACIQQMISSVIGDNVKVMIKSPDGNIDAELTDDVSDWLSRCSGFGRGLVDYVIPWSIWDNFVHGVSAWYKLKEEGGELTVQRLDPLTFELYGHDFTPGWRGIIQWSMYQFNLPDTFKQFLSWHPGIMSFAGHYSNVGQTLAPRPKTFQLDEFVIFKTFTRAPMISVIQYLVGKIEFLYYMISAGERYSFPIPIFTVPRNMRRMPDDSDFDGLLDAYLDDITNMRNSDGWVVLGEERDHAGNVIQSEQKMEFMSAHEKIKKFSDDLDWLNNQICIGLHCSMSMFLASGAELASSQVQQSAHYRVAREVRRAMEVSIRSMVMTYFEYRNEIVADSDVIIEWSSIRENESAQWIAGVVQLVSAGIIGPEEARNILRTRIGLNLSEISPDNDFTEEGDFSGEYPETPPIPGLPRPAAEITKGMRAVPGVPPAGAGRPPGTGGTSKGYSEGK